MSVYRISKLQIILLFTVAVTAVFFFSTTPLLTNLESIRVAKLLVGKSAGSNYRLPETHPRQQWQSLLEAQNSGAASAIGWTEGFLAEHPDNLFAAVFLGDFYKAENNYRSAADQYFKAQAVLRLTDLGWLAVDRKDFSSGEAAFTYLMKLSPNTAALGLSAAYTGEKKYTEALNVIGDALKKESSPAKIGKLKLSMGDVYIQQRNFSQAKEVYLQAIDLLPGSSQAHLGLGNALVGLQQYDQAILEIQKAVSLDQNNSFAYEALGLAYTAAQQYALADTQYAKSIELNPTRFWTWADRASNALQLNKPSEAIIFFTTALEKYAGGIDRLQLSEVSLQLGTTLYSANQKDLASHYAQNAISQNPANYSAWLLSAKILESQGQFAEALAAYQEVVRLNPQNQEANLALNRLK